MRLYLNPYVAIAKARERMMAERARRAYDVCTVQRARCLGAWCRS